MKKILLVTALIALSFSQSFSYKWEMLGNKVIAGTANVLACTGGNTVYATVAPFTICKSTNGGSDWSYFVIPQDLHKGSIYGSCFISDNCGYVCMNNTRSSFIVKTTDGAAHWTALEGSIPKPVEKIKFINEQYGWALGLKFSDGERNPFGESCLYVTEDCGKTWSQRILPQNAEMYDMFVIDENTGICVGSELISEIPLVQRAAIWKSIDKGVSWTKTLPEGCASEFALVVDFDKDGAGCAGMNDGSYYRTTDNGNSWLKASFQFNTKINSASILDINVGSGNVWSASDLNGFYISSDKGESWTRSAHNFNSRVKTSHFSDSDNGIVLLSDGDIFRTTNRGNDFHQVTQEDKVSNSDIFFFDDKVGLIASTTSPSVLRSDDGGISWQKVFEATNEDVSPNNATLLQFYANPLGKVFVLGSSYNSSKKSTKFFLYSSMDKGISWTAESSIDPAKLSRNLLMDEKGTFWNCSGSTLYRSNDNGASWIQVKTFSQFQSISFAIRSNAIWVFNSSNKKIAYSSNNGLAWRELTTPLPFVTSVYAIGNSRAVVYAFKLGEVDGILYQTDDGGMNWRRILSDWKPIFLYKPFVIDENTVWMATGGESLLHTSDGGQTWGSVCATSQTDELIENNQSGCSNFGRGLTACYFTDRDNGWALGNFVLRYKKGTVNATEDTKTTNAMPRLFPIPCDGKLSVSFDINGFDKATISVYDLLGNEVLSPKEYQVGSGYDAELDLIHLSSGCYFLKTKINSIENSIPFILK